MAIDKIIYPLVERLLFNEPFIGSDLYIPVDGETDILLKVTIDDIMTFTCKEKAYNINDVDVYPDLYMFRGLLKYASMRRIFNEEYYIVGDKYVQLTPGYMGVLESFSYTELKFTGFGPYNKVRYKSGFIAKNTDIAMREVSQHYDFNAGMNFMTTEVNLWLKLSEDQRSEFIVNKDHFNTCLIETKKSSYLLYDSKTNTPVKINSVDVNGVALTITSDESLNCHYVKIDEFIERFKVYDIKCSVNKGIKLTAVKMQDLLIHDDMLDIEALRPYQKIHTLCIKHKTDDGEQYGYGSNLYCDKIFVDDDPDETGFSSHSLTEVQLNDITGIYIVDRSCVVDQDFCKLVTRKYK